MGIIQTVNMKLLAIAIVSIGKAESCSSECPDGWSEFNLNGKSTCLKDYGVNPISNGFATCAAFGARLPLPLNQQHNDEMRAAFDALGAGNVALNINDLHVEGDWRKADGTAVEYFNWWNNQPNTAVEDQDYVTMLSSSGQGEWFDKASGQGKWFDYLSYTSVYIVCEQDKPKCCSTECPDGWREFDLNGKLTCLKDYGVNAISTAAAKCASLGARLPLPLNQQHNADLRIAFESLGAGYTALDGNDVQNEGHWRQTDGTPLDYFDWSPFQPDNALTDHGAETENYLGTWHNGQWNDFSDWTVDWDKTLEDYYLAVVHTVCEQDKPECCTADEIVLECSPNEIELYVPRCFFEKQGVSPSTVFVGEDANISACQGAVDGDNVK